MALSSLPRLRAEQALRQSSIPALRKLQVEETATEVILSGCVSSYYLKQMAQETVMSVLGGLVLLNQITVVRD